MTCEAQVVSVKDIQNQGQNTVEIRFKSFRAGGWIDPAFRGTNVRAVNKSLASKPWYWFNLNQTAGGWDGTIGKKVSGGKLISSQAKNKTLSYIGSGNPGGNGIWWTGAKIVVTSTKNFNGLRGNWECYIIDRSDVNKNKINGPNGHSAFKHLRHAGWSTAGGALYRHLKGDVNGIHQVFAVRWDKPRTKGTIKVSEIMKSWNNLGLVKPWHYAHGWLWFVETQKRSTGKFSVHSLILPNNN